MKPQIKLAESRTPDGAVLAIYEHDGDFNIRVDGRSLMSTREMESERVLGEQVTAHGTGSSGVKILIGGLGLGFTLRQVLQNVGPDAQVIVAELIPEVIDWNQRLLREVNGQLLDDARVDMRCADVADIVNRCTSMYHGIALDIDNGPVGMVKGENHRLYSTGGISKLYTALRKGGRLVVWSACEDEAFEGRMRTAGFKVEVIRAKRYPAAKRTSIFLYVGDKR